MNLFQVLLLDDNLFSSVPNIIQAVPNLKTLTLRGNTITSPPDSVTSAGLQSILDWLREHQPYTMSKTEQARLRSKNNEMMMKARREEHEHQRRRSRSRSVLRIVDYEDEEEEDENKENILRNQERQHRRELINRKRILKKLFIRNQKRKYSLIFKAWNEWAQVTNNLIFQIIFSCFREE